MEEVIEKYTNKDGYLDIAKMFLEITEAQKDQLLHAALSIMCDKLDKIKDEEVRISIGMIAYELTSYLMAKKAE